jgi:hypothetical protein
VACILASTFMRTLWIKPAWFGDGTLYPDLDFESLFCNPRGPCRSVLDCILHYFKRVSEHSTFYYTRCPVQSKLLFIVPDGKVTFRRQVLKYEEIPDWENSTKPICPIQVFDKGTIEDSTAHLHGDFANEYIGGGVLSGVSILNLLCRSLLISLGRDVFRKRFYSRSSPNASLQCTVYSKQCRIVGKHLTSGCSVLKWRTTKSSS